jgi:hypothetical protein
MIDRWIRGVTVAPVFLFASYVLFNGVVDWSGGALVVALIVALPVLAVAFPRHVSWLLAPSVLVFAFLGLISWFSPSVPSGGAADLVAGTLLGLPLWFLGISLSSPERPGLSLMAFQAGLLEMVTILTTVANAGGSAISTNGFVAQWFTTVGHQLDALGNALANHGLATPQTFPLAGYTDPVFLLLALVALIGVLLPMLRPDPLLPIRLPRPPRRDLAAPRRSLRPPVLYATTEPATAARAPLGAGVTPAIGAGVGVAAFVAVAETTPQLAFLAVTSAALILLVVLVRLARPTPPARGSRRRPGRRAAAAPR